MEKLFGEKDYFKFSSICQYVIKYFLWSTPGQEIMKDVDKTEPFVYAIEMGNSGFGKPTSELKRLV